MQLKITFLFVTAGIVQLSHGRSALRRGFKGRCSLLSWRTEIQRRSKPSLAFTSCPWVERAVGVGHLHGCQSKGLLQREQFILQAIQVHPLSKEIFPTRKSVVERECKKEWCLMWCERDNNSWHMMVTAGESQCQTPQSDGEEFLAVHTGNCSFSLNKTSFAFTHTRCCGRQDRAKDKGYFHLRPSRKEILFCWVSYFAE